MLLANVLLPFFLWNRGWCWKKYINLDNREKVFESVMKVEYEERIVTYYLSYIRIDITFKLKNKEMYSCAVTKENMDYMSDALYVIYNGNNVALVLHYHDI